MHAEIAFFVRVTRGPCVLDSLHRRPHDRLDNSQTRHLRSREARFPAPHNQHQRSLRLHVENEVHFVREMGPFIVLPIVLAGTESIRCFVPATTHGRFLPAYRKLVQRIEEIRAREISVEVMPGTTRSHRVMQHTGCRVTIKREQTSCIVCDGRSNNLHERLCSPLIVTDFDQIS